MRISVENKVALITGANRGIGKGIVESFLNHGASKVYLAVRDAKSTSDLVQKYGDKVVTLQVDVSDKNSIEALAQQAGDVQILVNNAGVLEIADPLSDNVEEALEKELRVNVFGLIRMAKAFAPILAAHGDGNAALVQMNSIVSIKNFTAFTTYSASKAAAYSITQGLRELFKPRGIHVLSVHPGPIATKMGEKAGFEVVDSVHSVSEGIVESLENGDFHLFPDTMAKQFQEAYQSYSDTIITADLPAE